MSDKKTVLILANSEIGFFCFRRELAESLLAHNCKVILSAPEGIYYNQLKAMGVVRIKTAVNRHGMNPFQDLMLIFHYVKLIRKEKPDIVLTYTIKPNLYGSAAAKLCRIPCISNITGTGEVFQKKSILQWLLTHVMRWAMNSNQCLFFQNAANMDMFQQLKITGKKKTLLPGSGVNLERHPYHPMPRSGVTKFLMLGRLCQSKGVKEYLTAAEKLLQNYPDTECYAVGEMETDAELEAMFDRLKKVQPRFHQLGLLSEDGAATMVSQIHCLVNPSYHEGMSNVIQEAAATGRAVIASDIPGCRELVDNNRSGWLIPVKNGEALYDAMVRFCQLSFAEKETMGLAGRQKMEKSFNRQIVINHYLEEIMR